MVLHLSRIKVKREYGMARLALLYKKVSGKFIPQFLLPITWKSCIADWHGRDDAGVRCLLCVLDGRRCRQKYFYNVTLITHLCRDHFFINTEQRRRIRRRVCRHCAFCGCPKCDQGFDGLHCGADASHWMCIHGRVTVLTGWRCIHGCVRPSWT